MMSAALKDKIPFLAGVWAGEGSVYAKVPYKETMTWQVLRTEPAIVINWQQFTKHATEGFPMHAENGFLKILPK